jgi:DNA-binding NtrC family response regulator
MARILIVDREPESAETLAAALEAGGWQTGVVHDGMDAVIQVIEQHWDTVLMDLQMPKLNGLSALCIMRSMKPELPVLMMTNEIGQDDTYEAARLGAFSILQKPVDVDKLVDILRQVMLVYNLKRQQDE